MSGTPLFSGRLAPDQSQAMPAQSVAPSATLGESPPSPAPTAAGKPMFTGRLAPDQPQPPADSQDATLATQSVAPKTPSLIDVIMRGNPLTSGIAAGIDATGATPSSLVEQGMSGINRGLAHTTDLPNLALSIGPALMNAIFKTNFKGPDWMPAPGDAIESGMERTGMVKPRSDNFADRLIESTGEGVGGALIPEVGLTARAGGTIADILKAMGPAATSGLASGTAAEVAPDNQGAQIAAGLIGGVVPSTALSGIRALTRPDAIMADGTAVPKKLTNAVKRDGIPLNQVGQRVAELGPAGAVADLGDNTQKLAMGIATQPGAPGATVSNAMRERAADSVNRVPAAVHDVLGPAQPPSQIRAGVRENMDNLSPEYQAVLANAQPVDTSAIAATLDQEAVSARGAGQQTAQQVRAMLNETGAPANGQGPVLSNDPAVLLATRNAIDGMYGDTNDTNVQRVLGRAREQINAELDRTVPGIRDADAKYRELARQRDGLEAGGNVLDGGKTAVWPQENAQAVAEGVQPQGTLVGPSATTFRLRQGARADIERIVGTKTNDRVALANIIQGDSDWNPQKLAQLFGQDRADAIMQVVQNERRMAETENLARTGSKTAAATAAQQDLEGGLIPAVGGIVRAGGWSGQNAVAHGVAAAIDKLSSNALQRRNQNIADAIMGRGDWTVAQKQPFFTPQQKTAQYAAMLSAIMRPATSMEPAN